MSFTTTERLPESNFRPRSKSALGALALIACMGVAPATLPSSVVASAHSELAQHRTTALSIAVVANDRIQSLETFGNADTNTAFSVGSVTKMFTAVSIMQLAERGRLSLDDHAAKYLPQYPSLDGVTIRELLNHTSGIPNYADDAIASGATASKTTPAQILTGMLTRPYDFAPGTDWNYTNTGYVALGQIVERVSGVSLASYEKRNIFEPLAMEHTYSAPAPGGDIAAAFNGSPGDWSWYYACGDIFASAADLARFDLGLMDGNLLRPGGFRAMQQTVPFTTLAPGVKDGLGIFIKSAGSLQMIGHHGGEPGFRADDEMIPAKKFAIAVVGNGAYDTAQIVQTVLRAYFPHNRSVTQTYVDGAPAVTQRMTTLIENLEKGQVDKTQLNVLARIALPELTRQIATFGKLRNLRFLSKAYTSSGILYAYEATFAERKAVIESLIDRSGNFSSLSAFPE